MLSFLGYPDVFVACTTVEFLEYGDMGNCHFVKCANGIIVYMNEELKVFLSKFEIAETDFEFTNLKWSELQLIKRDYKKIRKELNLVARYIEDKLQGLEAVHSVRCRVKDPDHLIAKIIRKKIKNPNRRITVENYKTSITDLIGIRAIHLFKEDWVFIHKFIMETWDLRETPIAYIREGDAGPHIEEYKDCNFNIEAHPYGYRSIHYLIESKPSKAFYVAEIQVRTIFEEGWSEIDHTIKYPKNVNDPLLDKFLDTFNILAGNSDQMGSFVRNLKNDLLKGTQKIEMYEKLTEENTGIINSLKKRVAGTVGELNSKMRRVEEKIHVLQSVGVDTELFENILRVERATVSKFELVLTEDPQKASNLFESVVVKLERLEKLLDVTLETKKHADAETSDDVTQYRKYANHFTDSVLTMAELDEDIGHTTVKHFRGVDESTMVVENVIHAIHEQNSFVRFLVGPKRKHLNIVNEEIATNTARIKALTDSVRYISDPAVSFVMQTQIDLFTQQNNKLKAFVSQKQRGVSMFGWIFKLFM